MKAHRGGECPTCEGTGTTDPDDGEETCLDCEGRGDCYWDWTCETDGECETCHGKDDVPVCGWGEDGETAICLPCARAAHARECGCDAEGWTKP